MTATIRLKIGEEEIEEVDRFSFYCWLGLPSPDQQISAWPSTMLSRQLKLRIFGSNALSCPVLTNTIMSEISVFCRCRAHDCFH